MKPPPWGRFVSAAALSSLVVTAVVAPALPAAAAGASIDLSVAVSADGHGPFTDADLPGGDASDHNGVVRTNDSVVYEVTANASGGTAQAETFTLVAPTDTRWARLPSDCIPAGSGIVGDRLTCALGDLTNATTKVSVVLSVSNSATNGESLAPTGSVVATGALPVAAASIAPVRVSAAPRFDLSISTVTPQITGATGPDGTTAGYRIVYPILIDWKGLTTGDGLLGYERLKGDISFVDDVSQMYGGSPSPAVLQGDGATPACGINTGVIPGAPGGRGGGDTAVVDSGRLTCTQSAPGAPIHVSVTGVDSSLSSIPSKNVSGGPIAGGTKAYVVSGYMSLWVPESHDLDDITAINRYTDLVAPSASGQTNYGTAGEPVGNNSISQYIGSFPGVAGSMHYQGYDGSSSTIYALSGKGKKPYTTPSQTVQTAAGIRNPGTAAWKDDITCSVFDNSVQSLADFGTGRYAYSNAPGITGRPQYAAFSASSPDAYRDATCGDDDATWYDSPNAVPGGAAAVGKVRWTFDHPAGQTISFYADLRLKPALANHTAIRAFTSIQPGAGRDWVHDSTPGATAGGAWADFLTATSDLARITSKVVDDGYDAETTPDETQYVEQGRSVTLALYPTLTNATPGSAVDPVTVEDTLPTGTTYVKGSATPEPTSVRDVEDPDGAIRQVLTWAFDDARPNVPLPTIVFTIRAASGAAIGPITNSATVSSTRDISSESLRVADRGLYVLGVGAVSAVDEAVRDGVVRGDRLEWSLRYSNNSESDFSSTDLIATLPYVGDDRTTTTATALVKPVPVQAGEKVVYTNAEAGSIDLDSSGSSNAAGGTTRWCAETAFATEGCPESLREVTGVRIQRSAPVTASTTVEHFLSLSSPGAHDGDRAGSDFGLRVAELSLPVMSNTAGIDIHAGSIGHREWFDKNADGRQDDSEPGISASRVRLTGSDDLGDAVDRSTTTDDEGDYLFDDLRPGDYTVMFGAADGGWTTPHVGDDRGLDSDVDPDGNASTTLVADLDGDAVRDVSSDLTVDAGALPRLDPGLVPIVTPPDHGEHSGQRPSAGGHAPVSAGTRLPAALAFTGSTATLWIIAGGLLVALIGLVAVVVSRRRSRGE